MIMSIPDYEFKERIVKAQALMAREGYDFRHPGRFGNFFADFIHQWGTETGGIQRKHNEFLIPGFDCHRGGEQRIFYFKCQPDKMLTAEKCRPRRSDVLFRPADFDKIICISDRTLIFCANASAEKQNRYAGKQNNDFFHITLRKFHQRYSGPKFSQAR